MLEQLAWTGFLLTPLVIVFVVRFVPLWQWWKLRSSGAGVGLGTLVGMRIRGVQPKAVVEPWARAAAVGIDIPVSLLEGQHLAGGNVSRMVAALIRARECGIDLGLWRAAAIDLAGHDVAAAVDEAVTPRSIQVTADGVAADGVRLEAVCRLSVRLDLDSYVGGGGEEELVGRIRETVQQVVGAAKSHRDVLRSPEAIPRAIQSAALDAGTGLEILAVEANVRR